LAEVTVMGCITYKKQSFNSKKKILLLIPELLRAV
jgi:hypothetical protein